MCEVFGRRQPHVLRNYHVYLTVLNILRLSKHEGGKQGDDLDGHLPGLVIRDHNGLHSCRVQLSSLYLVT